MPTSKKKPAKKRDPKPDTPAAPVPSGDGASGATEAVVLHESRQPESASTPGDDRAADRVNDRAGDHAEVRALTPTEVLAGPWGEVEVVNRTKTNLSPYAPIVKTENVSENSGNLTGYSIEVQDPDAPTGFTHLGNVSASYLLLSNLEVHEVAMEVAAKSGLDYRPSKVLWDGGRYMEVVEFSDLSREVEPGDEVRLALVMRNSYNKAWPLEATLAAVRFVCSNGMIAGDLFSRVRFKHLRSKLGSQSLSEVVGDAMRVLDTAGDDLTRFVDGLKALKSIPATHETMKEVRSRVLTPKVFGPQKWGEVTDRFYREEESTMYGLLNASTYATWHGRISASDISQNEAAVSSLLAYAERSRN